eukprot:864155-Rhodomonas_salina.1
MGGVRGEDRTASQPHPGLVELACQPSISRSVSESVENALEKVELPVLKRRSKLRESHNTVSGVVGGALSSSSSIAAASARKEHCDPGTWTATSGSTWC